MTLAYYQLGRTHARTRLREEYPWQRRAFVPALYPVETPPGGTAAVVHETFTASDGTELSTKLADTGQSWTRILTGSFNNTGIITSNALAASSTGSALYLSSANPGTANQYGKSSFDVINANVTTHAGFWLRTTSDGTGIRFVAFPSLTQGFIQEIVAGVLVAQQQVALTAAPGSHELEGDVIGSTARIFLNGTLLGSYTVQQVSQVGSYAVEVGSPSSRIGVTAFDARPASPIPDSRFTAVARPRISYAVARPRITVAVAR